jgi:ankyrin repeat protein
MEEPFGREGEEEEELRPPPLHLAAIAGDIQELNNHLHNEEVKVDQRDRLKSRTAFLQAAAKGHLDILHILKEKGADVNARDKKKETALHLASKNDRVQVVDYLIQQGVKVNLKNCFGHTAFALAAWTGRVDVVQRLLEVPDIQLATTDLKGYTPLHLATSRQGQTSVVSVMLEHQKKLVTPTLNVNETTKKGKTALHIAARRGHYDTVNCLLAYNPDINLRDYKGRTAVQVAALKTRRKVVVLLTPRVTEPLGQTPLHVASQVGNVELVEQLLENVDIADIDQKDALGRTALKLAEDEGHGAVVEVLKKRGAHQQDNEGNAVGPSGEGNRGEGRASEDVTGGDISSGTQNNGPANGANASGSAKRANASGSQANEGPSGSSVNYKTTSNVVAKNRSQVDRGARKGFNVVLPGDLIQGAHVNQKDD